jgi:Tol biopolymer transport system component
LLNPGTKLGPYEIQSPIGAGGMGEVYRARDTRLDRTVAVKILPAHLSNPEARQRFDREARAISSLNHPHICTLHDVGHQDGTDYLVMEFLEGETLQQRLLRGPLPLQEALNYGIQIAEALHLAHQAGIAHRDLKPGNIMLIKSGAKLLDFGLAKPVTEAVAEASSAVSLTPSTPTVTLAAMSASATPLTERGTVVGTFQYVPPEVLHGKNADARSDIFALGAVLYEMITGQQAFVGRSQLSVMTAILEKEPEPMAQIPPSLEHVVRTCLAKDPADRWQSAREVARELRWAAQVGAETVPSGSAAGSGARFSGIWIVVVLAALGLASAAAYYATRPAPASRLVASLVPPAGVFPDTSGRNGPPQISPDGRTLAFTGCKSESASRSILGGSSVCSIWVRPLRSGDAREVAGTAGGYAPFWSPDSREIGFFADGKLKRVAVDGGPVQVLCDAEDARGGSWGSSGTIVFAPLRAAPIFRVPAEGGTPVAITHSTATSNIAQMGSHRWPHFLPDSEHFLYVNSPNGGSCGDLSEIRFASLDGKQDMPVVRACGSPVFANGHLIYWREGNLVAQPLDPRKGVLSGTPFPIADHVAADALFGSAAFSASGNGTLVYRGGEGAIAAQLVWYDRTGKTLGGLGENDVYDSVAISPDGSQVATNAGMSRRILVIGARGSRTLVTCGDSFCSYPVWSADGREVYYASNAKGPYNIYAKAADGSRDERPVITFPAGHFGAFFLATSPDGQYLAYASPDAQSKNKRLQIFVLGLAGDHSPKLFLEGPADELAPAFSPDGKWLAYESAQSGRNEVYVTPFPAGGAQYQVSTNGGERPVWRRDGKEIFYRESLRLMAVKVTPKSNVIELAPPEALFEVAARNLNGRWYDVAPDGRFLMNTVPYSSQTQNFELVVNWPAELNQ